VHASVVLPTIVNTELGGGLRKTRASGTVEPEDVAATIVALVGAPRFETWVPHSNYFPYRVMSMLPRSWFEALGRATGATDILATADRSARAGYEHRARG
jgi:hypothetical protein